jgi:hypothetical protein
MARNNSYWLLQLAGAHKLSAAPVLLWHCWLRMQRLELRACSTAYGASNAHTAS